MAVPLHYTVDGPDDAPVLVLGPSLGTTGAMWEPQVPLLSTRLRVVRYDHRGHGGSPVPPGPYALADLGEDVLALMDTLGVARVHLGGASLGSFVALWVAENHPDRVARLILEGVGASAGTPQAWRERAETVRSQGMAAIAATVVSRWLPADFAAEHPGVHSALLDALLATPVEGYVGCCAAIESMDLAPDLGLVTAPALVIAGGEDQSVSPEFGRAVAAGITGAEFELIAGAAHLPNISHPDRVAHLMLDFLTA